MSEKPHAANTSRPRARSRNPDTPMSPNSRATKTGMITDGSQDAMRICSNILRKQPVRPFIRLPLPNRTAATRFPEKPTWSPTGDSIPLGSNLYTYQPALISHEPCELPSRPKDHVEDTIGSPMAQPKSPSDTIPSPASDESPSLSPDQPWKSTSQGGAAAAPVIPRDRNLTRLEDNLSEDIPIRAVLYGWDALGEAWELPPIWRTIRMLDKTLLHGSGQVERLVIFQLMHLLLRFHFDPTPERAALLPPFYNSRDLDFCGEDYICNFLPWPGVRALAKDPFHPIRSNRWFEEEKLNFRFLWPFGVQGCFSRSDTGLFKYAPEFSVRVHDMNMFTFAPDMFEAFPSIRGVCPRYNSIPGAILDDKEKEKSEIEHSWSRSLTDMVDDYMGDSYSALVWHDDVSNGRKRAYFTFW